MPLFRIYAIESAAKLTQQGVDFHYTIVGEGIERETLLEAMYLNLLVIGTRHAGTPELINDGETGFLCDEGSAESINQAITRVLQCEARVAIFAGTHHSPVGWIVQFSTH